jgi:RNA polymerase sigma factor (sigma-70 family)
MTLKKLLDQLFRNHHQELLRFAGQRAGDAAEDLVQLSFLRLLQHSEIDTIVNHRAYLYKLTANAVIDHHRKAAVRAQYHADFDEIDEVPSAAPCPEAVLHHQQMLERCLQALDALPILPRTVFLLHRFDGLTYPQIAKLLNLSRSSVERHFYTALEHCFAASIAQETSSS